MNPKTIEREEHTRRQDACAPTQQSQLATGNGLSSDTKCVPALRASGSARIAARPPQLLVKEH